MSKLLLIPVVTLLLMAGCTTASSSFAKKAKQSNFRTIQIQGLNFNHTIFENNVTDSKAVLHVYLGSDGTPWYRGRYITRDPTPLKPVMLRLMNMDKAPAIYLGRPCYHQHSMPGNCNKLMWTSHRYSQPVVDSMVVALSRYIQQHNFTKVKLFGFSGGGALAMLMASHFREISDVVTLAGNLDIDVWASYHGYLPLTGSLNPAKQPPLPLHIRQFHLAGQLDKNIPASIIKSVVQRQKNAEYIYLEKANHHCCWEAVWLSVLMKLE